RIIQSIKVVTRYYIARGVSVIRRSRQTGAGTSESGRWTRQRGRSSTRARRACPGNNLVNLAVAIRARRLIPGGRARAANQYFFYVVVRKIRICFQHQRNNTRDERRRGRCSVKPGRIIRVRQWIVITIKSRRQRRGVKTEISNQVSRPQTAALTIIVRNVLSG